MKRWQLFMMLFLLAVLFLLTLQWLLRPTEPFPHVWMRLPFNSPEVRVSDLDNDGSDEVICYDWQGKKGWLLKWYQGRFKLQLLRPFPLTEVPIERTLSEELWKGHYAVGRTKRGDIAIAELLPDGQWQVVTLAKDALSYRIGDLDGDGQDNDIVLLIGQTTQKGKLVWIQRRKGGHWQKVSETTLTLPAKPFVNPFMNVKHGNVVIIWRHGLTPVIQRIFFWQGKGGFIPFNDWSIILRGNWDGDEEEDILWFYWQLQSHRLNLVLRSTKWQRTFNQTKQFPHRQLIGWESTNKLGDAVQHLLLALYKGQRVHLLDGVFTSSGWRWNEIVNLSVPILASKDRIVFHIGDADGDEDSDLVVQLVMTGIPIPKDRFWLLQRKSRGWSVRAIPIRQNEIIFCKYIGKRLWLVKGVTKQRFIGPLWHYIYPHTVTEFLTKLCTFHSDGRLKVVTQAPGGLGAIDDLDRDNFPELITHQSHGFKLLGSAQFWFRSSNGKWRGFELPIPIKFRRLVETITKIPKGATLTYSINHVETVRWDGKKWFLLVWDDGLLQAVTVP